MIIRPLQAVGEIPFGADRSALSGLGSPLRQPVSRLGEDEVEFGDTVYRFLAGRLVEVSFRVPPVISINGESVEAGSLVAFLRQHDPRFHELYGFAIAPG